MKALRRLTVWRWCCMVSLVTNVAVLAHADDTETLERIEKILQQQQEQIERQAKTIEHLKNKV